MIKTLKISNFRAYQNAELELEKLNWICGEEEQGKSSVLLALEFALWRRNEYVNDRGEGLQGLVHTGAKKALVSCVTDAGEYFQNSIPSAAGADASADFDSEIVKACLRCRYLFQMKEKDQKEFFQSILLGPITQQVIFRELNMFDEQFPDLGDRFRNIAQDMVTAVDVIDPLFLFATAERKRINAEYDALNLWNAPAKPEISKNVPEKEVAKAQKQYEEAQKKVIQEEESLKHQKHLAERDLRDWNALSIIAEKRQIELAAAEKELAAAVANQKNGTDYTKALQKNQAELKKINAEIQALQHKIDALTGDESCPGGTCARVDLKHHNNAMKDLQGKKSAATAQAQDLIYRRNETIKAAEKLQAAQARLDRAQKAIDEAEPLGPQPVVMELDEMKLSQLRAHSIREYVSRNIMEKDFRNGEKCAEIDAAIAKKSAELEEITVQKKMWDLIVKALGPHGIKVKLLHDSIGKFQAEINQKLAFFGVQIRFDLEPWQILADTGKGYGFLPIQFLSHTAATKVSIGLQIAIAQLTGFHCVAIDEHGFGPMLRSRLFAFLLKEEIQSIVISTLIEVDAEKKLIIPKNPGLPDVKLFHVEKGAVKEL